MVAWENDNRNFFGSRRIFHAINAESSAKVYAYSKYIPLRSKVPDITEATQIADEALKCCGINGQKWIEKVKSLHNSGISFQEERLEIQYFCIGG